MLKKAGLMLTVFVLCAALLLSGCSQPQQKEEEKKPSETFEFKFSTFVREDENTGKVAKHWIELVEERTNGRVKITPYWGATFASNAEHPSLLSSGALELAMFPPNIFVSEMPLSSLVTSNISAGFTREELIEASHKFLFEIPESVQILEEEGKRLNIKFLAPQILGSLGVISKTAFNTLDDMKGWRVTSEGTADKVWSSLGLVPVYVDAVDLYESLSRGVVDAVHLLTVPIVQMNIHEIGKCYREWDNQFMIGLPISVNLSVWNSLPADIQEIFLEASKECSFYSIELDEKANSDAWATMEKAGVDVGHFSREDTQKRQDLDRQVSLDDTWMGIAKSLGYENEAKKLLEVWEGLLRP